MIKKTGIFIGLVVLLIGLAFGAMVAANNTGGGEIEQRQVKASLDRTIGWLAENKAQILDTNNPLLWWWLMRSANITRDPRLLELYFEYHRRYLKNSGNSNAWAQLFDARPMRNLRPEMISLLPEYNQYMLFGLSCSAHLLNTDIIRRQMQTDFCSQYHPISPACVTHQMMGLNFRIKRQCGEPAELEAQMAELQDKVVMQLTLDPRVVDVYLQRVLMLLDTGAGERVKSRWIERVLDAQLDDGGWGGIDPLIPVGGNKAIGFSSKSIKLAKLSSNFHATAQGLLIMSLLQENPQLAAGR